MPQTRHRTGRSLCRDLCVSPFEQLEQRRLLSAATVDVVNGAETARPYEPRVTEYNVLTGEVQTLDYGERINAGDADLLDDYLRDAGYNGLEDLLSSLGTPDEFLGSVNRLLGGNGDAVLSERPGHDPSDERTQWPQAKDGLGRSVVGSDDRVQVTDTLGFPFSAVGRLGIGCSGAMIGPFHFLTAGHCVTSGNGFVSDSAMRVSLGQDGADRPYGIAEPTFVRTYDEWFDGDWEHDWAVITLDRNIGDHAGYFGSRVYGGTNGLANKDVSILQYPGDKPFGTQWLAEGPVGYSTDGKVFYGGTLDTAGGSSGSSVWEQLDDDDTPIVLGVHGYGAGGGQFNSAARITQRKFDDMNLWEQADLVARAPTDKPDLASVASFMPNSPFAGVGTPNPVPAGGQLDLDIAVRNFGTLAAQGVTVDVYLSTNSTITDADTLLTSLTLDEVLPFETLVESFTTRVPSDLGEGTYSIGFIIDAADTVDEFVETNNADAVSTLTIGSSTDSGTGGADRFESNESFAQATNLGTLGELDLSGLSIHTGQDEDFFSFTADQTGNANITLTFSHSTGDVDAQVLNAAGTEIERGTSATNNESLNFNVVQGQQYFLRVYGWNGATNTYAADFDLPGIRTGGPAAIDARFVYEAAQQFTFDFDFSLDLDTIDASDVLVTNLTTGQSFAGDADFTFAGGPTSLTWASTSVLPDGNYRATIPAGSVSSVTGSESVQDEVLDFFVLAGDANRDRQVDLADFLVLRANFATGNLFGQGDFSYDGLVDLDDFIILRSNFGTSLPEDDGAASLFA